MKPSFTLIAGVEISDGHVGLLSNGAVDASAHLGDPVAAARRWVGEGAQWIHVADLDAATGRGSNHAAIKAVADSTRGKAHLQVAGGIRDAASFEQALQLRPQRIVLDTAALADLPWLSSVLATHADVVAVDLAVHKLTLHAPGTSVPSEMTIGTPGRRREAAISPVACNSATRSASDCGALSGLEIGRSSATASPRTVMRKLLPSRTCFTSEDSCALAS